MEIDRECLSSPFIATNFMSSESPSRCFGLAFKPQRIIGNGSLIRGKLLRLRLLSKELGKLASDFHQCREGKFYHSKSRSRMLGIRAVGRGLIPNRTKLIRSQSVDRCQIGTILTDLEKSSIQDQIAVNTDVCHH